MIRLVLADVRAQSTLWAWSFICATIGAACASGSIIAMLTAIGAARDAEDTRMVSASIALGGNVVFFTLLAAIGVVSSAVNLTFTAQRREHALWLILGVPRRRVRMILRGELLILGAVAGALASGLAPVIANVSLTQWSGAGLDLHGAYVGILPWHVGISLLGGIVPCLIGGWSATRRAANIPEIRAFRDQADPPARPSVMRIVFAALLLAGVLGMWIPGLGLTLPGGVEQATAFAFAGSLFLICLLLVLGPWVLTPLLKAWTAVIPRRGVAWHLAVQSCHSRATRSVTTVLPFALSLAIVALFMLMGTVMPGSTAGIDSVLVVLGWVFLVSWVGGVAVIALVSGQRRRDNAVIAVAGARPGTITRATVYEGAIYAGTAILFGTACLVISALTIGLAAQRSPLQLLAALPWNTLLVLVAITLLTTCTALLAQGASASRHVAVRALRD